MPGVWRDVVWLLAASFSSFCRHTLPLSPGLKLQFPRIYLFPVLETLQHRQVIVPGVFGAKPGQVVSAHRLLSQLPAGRAPPRQRGPGALVPLIDSRVPRREPRTSNWVLHFIDTGNKFGNSFVLSLNRMYKQKDAHQEQEQRNTYAVRHLHRASQPAAAFRSCRKYGREDKVPDRLFSSSE